MPSYSRHSCQWWACSAQHRVMLSLQLRAFLSSPPPALASVSFAAQSAHCSPASRTPRRPTAPRPPNRPALLAFPPPLPTERTCEHKAEHAGPPTAKSLPEWCEQEPWPPPSCRHPLSPHPRPLAVTSHLTSSPPLVIVRILCMCVFRLLSTKLQPPGGTIVTAPSGLRTRRVCGQSLRPSLAPNHFW